MKPRIAITVGDPAGIGPEIAAAAAAGSRVPTGCDPATYASANPGTVAPGLLSPSDSRVRTVCNPVLYRSANPGRFAPGLLSAAAGRAAYDAIVRAVEAARQRPVDAIATARLNKEALRLAGLPWNGHTDLLAHLTGA